MNTDNVDIESYLDQYKLRHSEVVLAAFPGNQYILKEKIDEYLKNRGQIALDLGDYPAYMAINPTRLSRKKKYFVAHVPHHDLGIFIGERGRNIKRVASNLVEVYKNQFKGIPEDLRITIIILPLFLENQMVIKDKNERYIYKLTIDAPSKEQHIEIDSVLADNYVYPLYSEGYYKRGNHRITIYFKGRTAAANAKDLIARELPDLPMPDKIEFYQKVKAIYDPKPGK